MSSGGWTILQRRTGSSVNFYRNWNEYKNGFGIPTGDHWIGNDKIYSLTKQPNINYQLIVEKTNTEGSTYHSRYSSFRISNEGDKYRLSLSDYNGNAGNNAMGANSGHRFSTHDQDNDGSSTFDCAEKHRGGWWYPDDSNTGSTSNCYSFSNRIATGGYEYSDCGCYEYCTYYCYYYYYYCYDDRRIHKCTDCYGCSGSDNYRCCKNKNPAYETTFYSCGYSNFNGDYSHNDYRGIFWKNLHGSDCGITTTTMKIRSVQ
ncbi:ficolin-1-like isoform X1 [Apostichopus japonicus]|uniref:ficolin-1-like isoform X1 n=1 Tax=Stichopus japonicus TaxID=307972 RepID=UPI003AB1A8A0